MADNFIEMQLANITLSGEMRVFAHEMELSLSSTGDSQWIIIPLGITQIAVTISFSSGGRGKIQTTTDIIRRIKDNDGIIPVDWSLGVVNNTIQDSVIPVTALRLVQTSETGSSKISVRAQ
jgi:hypothetical protein